MSAPGHAPAAAAPRGTVDEAERRRRIRRSAIVFAAIAIAFYVGFIAMMLARGAR
jgi:hypothetical protein